MKMGEHHLFSDLESGTKRKEKRKARILLGIFSMCVIILVAAVLVCGSGEAAQRCSVFGTLKWRPWAVQPADGKIPSEKNANGGKKDLETECRMEEDNGIFDQWLEDPAVWERARLFYKEQGWVFLSKLSPEHHFCDRTPAVDFWRSIFSQSHGPDHSGIEISEAQKKKIQNTFSASLQVFFPEEKHNKAPLFTCESAEEKMQNFPSEFLAAAHKRVVPWHVDALHVRQSRCHKARICVALGDGATNTVELLRSKAEGPRKSLQEYFDLWDEEFWTLSTFQGVLDPRWDEDEEIVIPCDPPGEGDRHFWEIAQERFSKFHEGLHVSLQEKIEEIRSARDPLGALQAFVHDKFQGKYSWGEVLAQTRQRTKHPERLPLVESVQEAINNGDATVVELSETCDTLGRILLVDPRTGFHRSPVAAGKRSWFAKMDFFG